ncbi:hypothetical protein LCGC14_2189270 [marine sediment metagenome]|uniref:Uncharacterized protein n=1 Tax=marine sediment metagenome TaxID=412755 RepID=A0A0F9GFW7_9ZZZZ
MPIRVEISLDPNNRHEFHNIEGGLALLLDGEYGLSVRVTGRKQDWRALVQRLVEWGLIKVELKDVTGG